MARHELNVGNTSLGAAKLPKSMPKTMSELRVPNLNWDYFSGAQDYPFENSARTMNLTNAWWFSELCFLVYISDRDFVNQQLQRAGFDGALAIYQESNHALVVRGKDKLIVCFRGTLMDSLDNLVTDAKIARTPFNDLGLVHRGFLQALDSLWPHIEAELNKRGNGREIWFTGHSLGAAMATLGAARWNQPCQVYTFGSPRVGDLAFRENYPPLPHYRFVHDHDAVTQLPPPVGYRHGGQIFHLRRDGSILNGTDVWSQLKDNLTDRLPGLIKKMRAEKGVVNAIISDNAFADHCPMSYVVRLWNLIEK